MKNEVSENLHGTRHSLAHLLAIAVREKDPGVKLGIGPVIENGFYYDFEFSEGFSLSNSDLKPLEKRMRELVKKHLNFSGEEVTVEEAENIFKTEPYKQELISEFSKEGKKLTVYRTGDDKKIDFIDLCKGGHVASTKEIPADAFTLTHIAGAYWKGSEKNKMLTRIYGLAFMGKQELGEYMALQEEAKKRDHKKLGAELELFLFHETAPGMPYWLPKGVTLYNALIDFWRKEHRLRGYQEIISPILNKKELYVTSGHFEHYWPEMFVADMGENEQYGVKAMNCPNAMVIYGSKNRSYRELPLRLGDTDYLHRYERSGTLNGLLRVREFRQDDAHIFVTEEQIGSEYEEIFQIVERFYSIFGIEYQFRLGTRPESFMGDIETWEKAEGVLSAILKKSKKDYFVLEGDGAFYGPKVDILMKDALGREWQMGTIQLDFQQPKRFNLEYADSDGTRKMPVVIHRVIYGSMERFIGILIEHYGGAFPLWLAPVQVAVLPIAEKHIPYAKEIHKSLQKNDTRAVLWDHNETLGKKIRNGKKEKIPYLVVIGDQEIESNTVTVENRDKGKIGAMTLDELVTLLSNESIV